MIMNARFLHLDSPESANLCMQSRNISKKFDLIRFMHTYPHTESVAEIKCMRVCVCIVTEGSSVRYWRAASSIQMHSKYEGNDAAVEFLSFLLSSFL